jgi:hypothetical protein
MFCYLILLLNPGLVVFPIVIAIIGYAFFSYTSKPQAIAQFGKLRNKIKQKREEYLKRRDKHRLKMQMETYRRFTTGIADFGILVPTTQDLYNLLKAQKDHYYSTYKYSQEHFNKFKKIGSVKGFTDLNSNLLVFFFIFIFFFFIYFKYYLLFDNNFYSIWGNIGNNEGVPRPTGMARLAIVFSAYYFCSYILKKKYLFFLILFNYMIFAFQSRVVIFSLLLISLIFILIKERYSIVKTFKNLILIFIIPFIISVFIDFSKREILFKSNDNKLFKSNDNKTEFINRFSDIRVFNSEINSKNFTSNRKEDWQKILKKFDKQRVFGYGIHGDRILINQTASNGFLYSLVSGGYLGAISYCIIIIYSLFLVNLALLKKKFNKYSWFASSMIIFFLIRSLVENSFTIVSFDFIIFFSSIFYLEKTFFYKSKFKIKA